MNRLVECLTGSLGADKIFVDDETLSYYTVDGLRPNRGYLSLEVLERKPLAVVRPTSTAEVAAVVKIATAHQCPVVPYGGGTGLMGGAVAIQPSIVVDLRAMDRVMVVNREDRTVVVEAGVILANLEGDLNKHGLMLGHDPWSLPIATVGGAISTDGLGYRAAKYGSMGDQVLGLRVVMPDGEVLAMRSVPHHSTGLNLNRLFIGTEGSLGIITEATLRVYPQPEARVVRAYSFPGFEAGFAAIMAMCEVGLQPAALDYGERFAAPSLRSRRHSRWFESEDPSLYLVFEGLQEEVQAQNQRAAALCAEHGGRDLGRREAQSFWDHRHRIAERYARNRRARPTSPPDYYLDYVHVTIPASKVLEYRRKCQDILERRNIQAVEYGIWCQPELFSVVMVKAAPKAGAPCEAMSDTVDTLLRIAHEVGGSMEYCHGVGLRLAHLMEEEHGSSGLAALRAIKKALDPLNIMNPGKLSL